MLVTLATRTFTPEPTAAALRLGALARALADLAPADLPGVRLLVDGRAVTSPEAWAGTPRITIGGGSAPAC